MAGKHIPALMQQASKGAYRAALYKKAIALYTGDFGDFLKEDLYAEWSVFERELLTASCVPH